MLDDLLLVIRQAESDIISVGVFPPYGPGAFMSVLDPAAQVVRVHDLLVICGQDSTHVIECGTSDRPTSMYGIPCRMGLCPA